MSSKISVCVPAHKGMKNHDFFLERVTQSFNRQNYENKELIVTYEGKMAENTNASMRQATGDLIKILYLDDYLNNVDALTHIAEAFEKNPDKKWLVSGCLHDNGKEDFYMPHLPSWSPRMKFGANTIGSPSVVTLRKGLNMYFDEHLSWLLDCDLYERLNDTYGQPIYLEKLDVTIGLGDHQMTNILSPEDKEEEFIYLNKKYAR